jgi:hypothetical protein
VSKFVAYCLRQKKDKTELLNQILYLNTLWLSAKHHIYNLFMSIELFLWKCLHIRGKRNLPASLMWHNMILSKTRVTTEPMSTIFPSPARIYFKSELVAFLSFGVATGDFDNSPLVTQPQAAHTIQSFPRSCRLFSPHPLLSSLNIFAAQSAGSSQVSFLEAFQHRGTSRRRCQRPAKQYSRNQPGPQNRVA